MWDKRSHATYIVSNLCFDPRMLTAWVRRVRRRGVDLPIRIGLAGPVERTKLLAMAGKIGVSESARFLGKHLGWFARLATTYSPDRLLGRLELSNSDVVGLHVFTFNQVAETERWRVSR
jgi:methylenetetrahydrofolate reductase (NADPH)